MSPEKIPSIEEVKVKKITLADWDKIKQSRLEAVQSDPQAFGITFKDEAFYDESKWQERLSDTSKSFYAIEVNNTLIATAGVRKGGNNTWNIMAVYTHPKWRGRGLSSKILNEIINEAKLSGVEKLILYVEKEQQNAISLYEKLGFKIVDVEKDVDMADDKKHELYNMEKDLAKH